MGGQDHQSSPFTNMCSAHCAGYIWFTTVSIAQVCKVMQQIKSVSLYSLMN